MINGKFTTFIFIKEGTIMMNYQLMTVKERATGDIYAAIPQAVDLNYDGKFVLRYIIGIMGHTEFHFLRAVYDNDEFNNEFEVMAESWQQAS